MDIDAILATASPEEAKTPQATEAPAETPVKETPKIEEDLSLKADSELTPEQLTKRQSNRESKLNSKLAEMKRVNRELQARLGQQPQPSTEAPKDSKVKTIDDFDTWEAWTDYQLEQKLEQKLSAKDKQSQQIQQNQELSKWADERGQVVDKRVEELATAIPDFSQTLEEIEELIPALSPELARIALEADDINLAVYALHREGKLQEVLKMPPSMVAKEVAKAEIRGQAYLNQKTTTSAPTPLTPARGNTGGGTSIEKMDGVQLLRSLRKKG